MTDLRAVNAACLFMAAILSLTGCATKYIGKYSIASQDTASPEVLLTQAESVRSAFVNVAEEVGLVVRERPLWPHHRDLLPGLLATQSDSGLKSPYSKLAGANDSIYMVASFEHPFYIMLQDRRHLRETECIREIRRRLERELEEIEPPVVVKFRFDWVQLD